MTKSGRPLSRDSTRSCAVRPPSPWLAQPGEYEIQFTVDDETFAAWEASVLQRRRRRPHVHERVRGARHRRGAAEEACWRA